MQASNAIQHGTYLHPVTLSLHNADSEQGELTLVYCSQTIINAEYQLCFVAERCWWDRVGAVLRLVSSLKLIGDLWGRAQRLRNTPLVELTTWRRHVAGEIKTSTSTMCAHVHAGLAVIFLPLQLFACLSLLLLTVKVSTRTRLTALLNINAVIALSTMIFIDLEGQQWTCHQMPQVLQYAVFNLLVFPLLHTQCFARHLLLMAAALLVAAFVVARPGGLCDFVQAHAEERACARLQQLTGKGFTAMSSLVSFVAQGQVRLQVDPCRTLWLFVMVLCGALSTLVLYHVELASRVAFLVNRQLAPAMLMDRQRDQLARDVALAVPVLVYVFWVFLVLTGHRM